VFTGLLDPEAGHWLIRPQADYEVTRRYVEGSMVVQTEFRTCSGLLRLTDGLALGPLLLVPACAAPVPTDPEPLDLSFREAVR
jgi:hypothetical protein